MFLLGNRRRRGPKDSFSSLTFPRSVCAFIAKRRLKKLPPPSDYFSASLRVVGKLNWGASSCVCGCLCLGSVVPETDFSSYGAKLIKRKSSGRPRGVLGQTGEEKSPACPCLLAITLNQLTQGPGSKGPKHSRNTRSVVREIELK